MPSLASYGVYCNDMGENWPRYNSIALFSEGWGGWQSVASFLIAWFVFLHFITLHYSDALMSAMASQITGVLIVCSTVCSGAGQRKHQSSASMAFVKGVHRCRWPMDSPHKGPVTQKMLSFDDVIMLCQCSFTWHWGGWGCEVSCGGHHWPRGKTTTGSAVDGTVFDIAQILAYLVHIWTPMSSVRKKARPINLISLSLSLLLDRSYAIPNCDIHKQLVE